MTPRLETLARFRKDVALVGGSTSSDAGNGKDLQMQHKIPLSVEGINH